jgi:hypothetical protein
MKTGNSSGKITAESFFVLICLALIFFFFATIMIRLGVRQLLIKRGKINSFTNLVWFDNDIEAGRSANGNFTEVQIDWKKIYPFDGEIEPEAAGESKLKIFQREDGFSKFVFAQEEMIKNYATNLLIFYSKIVEASNVYEKIIGWNFASFGEYNGVVQLSDGFLTSFTAKKDVTENFTALKELDDFCRTRKINFAYVQAPHKISSQDKISGTADFSNQNADDLLFLLKESGVEFLDLRQKIREDNLNHRSLFYRTDHHWKTETGLYASKKILEFMNEKFGFESDTEKLDAENFTVKTWREWFLGSQGKKVTLARCTPDDFSLIFPKYETLFRYVLPSKKMDETGSYSVAYDMTQVEKKDYYARSPYHANNFGDRPLIQIENLLDAEKKRILIMHDSFGDCVISCLALAEKNVDSIDLRHFTGSVKNFIVQTSPDAVLVLYNPSQIEHKIDFSTHESPFDFR